MTELNFVIYARKSMEGEDRQVESIDSQLTELHRIVERDELQVEHVFEESKSAKVPFLRPQFTEMIRMIETGEANAILCWQFNRLSRNPAEGGMLQQLLQDRKLLEIRTADRVYTPEDNVVVLGVEASVAQQFSIDLGKHIKRGIRQKTRKGGISGQAPEGYVNHLEKQGKQIIRSIKRDELRFPIIRSVFDMFLGGDLTAKEICNKLNAEGYTTASHGIKGNKPINPNMIYRVLNNPRYMGMVPDPDDPETMYPSEYEPMITQAEFDRIQSLLSRKGKAKYTTKKYFELRGLFRCGECQCLITAETKEKKLKNGNVNYHTYYHCTKRKPGCKQKGITEAEMFAQVGKLIGQYSLHPKLYEWGLKALNELAKKEIKLRDQDQLVMYESVKTIQSKLDRLLDLVSEGIISKQDYSTKSKSLKDELYLRESEQKQVIERAKNWYELVGKTLERMSDLSNQFTSSNFNEKKLTIDAIGYNAVLIDQKLKITPNDWLVPVVEALPELNSLENKVRTDSQQFSSESDSVVLSNWYSIMYEVRTKFEMS